MLSLRLDTPKRQSSLQALAMGRCGLEILLSRAVLPFLAKMFYLYTNYSFRMSSLSLKKSASKDSFIYLFYLFIFGCVASSLLRAGFLQLRRAGATLRCGARASHCGGFSCCGARASGTRASVVVALGLQSAGSVAVVHGLSCSAARGIFPDQGSNPCPRLHWQADS